jgi:3-hydroxypropanoate dehydrogenase
MATDDGEHQSAADSVRPYRGWQAAVGTADERGQPGQDGVGAGGRVLAVDTDFHDKIPELLPFRPEMRDNFVDQPEMREQLARFNGALQAGYFILAVRAAGLAAGPMLGFDGPGIDAEFFTGRSWKTILVVNIGQPGLDPWFDRLPRLPHEDYVEYV